jgi:acyl-CoA synthetase (AMP-forming)/AMP-acid ligase II
VREYVGSRIARYKRPTWVEFTTALPRNTVGMVDRDAVQSLWGTTPEG